MDRWDPGLRTWVAADERSAARRLTGQLAGRGYQQIKVLNSLSLETVQAICEEASLAGLRVTGHCPDGATFEQAIDAGMSSFEHLTGIWRGRLGEVIEPLGLHNLALEMLEAVAMGVDEDAIRHLAHDMAARDVWNCPTLVAHPEYVRPAGRGHRQHPPEANCQACPQRGNENLGAARSQRPASQRLGLPALAECYEPS